MNYIQRRFFFSSVVMLCLFAPSYGVQLAIPVLSDPTPGPLTSYDAVLPSSGTSSGITSAGTFTSNLGGFNLVLVPNGTLTANPQALAAFNRAAAQWSSRISSPVTVTINANLASLGSGIIGSTSSVTLQDDFDTVRNQLIANSASETDDGILASIPTAASFTASIPATIPGTVSHPAATTFTLDSNIIATKANFKAMGYDQAFLNTTFGVSDASITFSTNFAFDYDNSDGVTPGSMDFETVAAHEIGHALGFVSVVDSVDNAVNTQTSIVFGPTTLDLFRFANSNNTLLDPTDAATFANAVRNLVPGADGITDFGTDTWGIGSEFGMSTGLTQGDGRQASHWKDDVPLGPLPYIGIMDPTLSFGQIETIQETDFRALDLIGWNISPIPEPSTYALGLTGFTALYWLRRKRALSLCA